MLSPHNDSNPVEGLWRQHGALLCGTNLRCLVYRADNSKPGFLDVTQGRRTNARTITRTGRCAGVAIQEFAHTTLDLFLPCTDSTHNVSVVSGGSNSAQVYLKTHFEETAQGNCFRGSACTERIGTFCIEVEPAQVVYLARIPFFQKFVAAVYQDAWRQLA